jgi:hypothetical protein
LDALPFRHRKAAAEDTPATCSYRCCGPAAFCRSSSFLLFIVMQARANREKLPQGCCCAFLGSAWQRSQFWRLPASLLVGSFRALTSSYCTRPPKFEGPGRKGLLPQADAKRDMRKHFIRSGRFDGRVSRNQSPSAMSVTFAQGRLDRTGVLIHPSLRPYLSLAGGAA